MNIIEQLNQLGLNGRQARVYLALLQLGSATAIEIAKYTKYKHPTVYDVLDILKEKRLITETFSGGRKIFSSPCHPVGPSGCRSVSGRWIPCCRV